MQIFLQYVICCFFLSVTNSLFKFLLLLNGYLLQSEDVCWNRLEHTKRRVKVSFLSRNAFTGADPGFFLGGGAPLTD